MTTTRAIWTVRGIDADGQDVWIAATPDDCVRIAAVIHNDGGAIVIITEDGGHVLRVGDRAPHPSTEDLIDPRAALAAAAILLTTLAVILSFA